MRKKYQKYLQTPPFCKLPHFLRLLPPLEREVFFMQDSKTFITRHSVIQRRSRPKLFRACGLQ